MNQKETLNISILGRSYTLLCTPEEKTTLLASVALVDQKMSFIDQQMNLTGHDKIAVFAALQIAHELLQLKLHNSTHIESTERLEKMNKKIDATLQQLDKSDI